MSKSQVGTWKTKDYLPCLMRIGSTWFQSILWPQGRPGDLGFLFFGFFCGKTLNI